MSIYFVDVGAKKFVSAANNSFQNVQGTVESASDAVDARKENYADKCDKENVVDNQAVMSHDSATDAASAKVVSRSSIKQSQGVFFRLESAQFGSIEVGTLTRMKLELCNATNFEASFNL